MNESTTGKCAGCGASDPQEPWYAVCGSISTWEQNNWPAPNLPVDTCDDVTIWQIALCKPCSIGGYQTSRKKLIRNSIIGLVVSAAIAAFYVYLLIGEDGSTEGGSDALIFGAATLGGTVGVLISIVLIGMGIVQLNRSKSLQSVSEKIQHAGIEDFAKRLIKELEGDASEERKAQFPLPGFKEKSELGLPPEVEAKINNKKYGRQKRIIDGVQQDRGVLIQCLSDDWRVLLPAEPEPKPERTDGSILGQIQQ